MDFGIRIGTDNLKLHLFTRIVFYNLCKSQGNSHPHKAFWKISPSTDEC